MQILTYYDGHRGEQQPMQTTALPWSRARGEEIVALHRELDGAALPILHALQREFGYIDREAVPLVAQALNPSRAEIHGVVSFYHDFRDAPPGRHVLKLCRAETCQSMERMRWPSRRASDCGSVGVRPRPMGG